MRLYKRVLLLYGCGTAVLLGALWVVADRPAAVVVGVASGVVALSAAVGWLAIGRELDAEGRRSRKEAAPGRNVGAVAGLLPLLLLLLIFICCVWRDSAAWCGLFEPTICNWESVASPVGQDCIRELFAAVSGDN